MPQFSVTFTFDADSLEDAEARVGEWKVTEGVTLMSISGSVRSNFPPTPVGDNGDVSDAITAGHEAEDKMQAYRELTQTTQSQTVPPPVVTPDTVEAE